MVVAPKPITFAGYLEGVDAPSLDLIRQCVHCGMCLPTCPTYEVLGVEMDNPRGRIRLAKSVYDGKTTVNDSFDEHMYTCLDCRACETACPSGVQFGKIVEAARAQIEAQRPRGALERILRWFFFDAVLPHPRRLALIARSGAAAATLGRPLLRAAGTWSGVAARLLSFTALLPDRRLVFEGVPPRVAARGQARGRVALFLGCVMRAAFGDVNAATARVLARNGWDVLAPRDQTCCGALHVHAGDREPARELARRNIARLEGLDVRAIVVNAAGCGANLKEYGWLLKDDPVWAGRAEAFAKRVKDVTEFLADEGLSEAPGPLRARAAYDDPCHLLHGQKIKGQPRALLAAIPELEVVPLEEADWCCGSAGIYNVTRHEISMRLLHRKVERIKRTGADLLVTANPGCAIQIEAGLRKAGVPIPVVHIVELLDRAYASPA
jgi:glycolate oxidase iron-sulfur subunit